MYYNGTCVANPCFFFSMITSLGPSKLQALMHEGYMLTFIMSAPTHILSLNNIFGGFKKAAPGAFPGVL